MSHFLSIRVYISALARLLKVLCQLLLHFCVWPQNILRGLYSYRASVKLFSVGNKMLFHQTISGVATISTTSIIKLLGSMIIKLHCAKSVRIWSYSGPHCPAFRLNTERYRVSLRIQAECGKCGTE